MEKPDTASSSPSLSLEDLAFMLRKAADDVWAQAENYPAQKLMASQVHELAAKLLAIHVQLEQHRRMAGMNPLSST